MPHVHAIFPESECTKALLRKNKLAIREAVAKHTGYPLDQIALIPNMVPYNITDLSDNLMALEFKIDVGSKCTGQIKGINPKIRGELLDTIEELRVINFGIWLCAVGENDFIEHKPA